MDQIPSVDFTISDFNELLELNKALMEIRYHADNVRRDVRGSGFLSSIHVRIISEIIASLERSGKEREAAGWRDWMRLENRSLELEKIMAHIRGSPDPDTTKLRLREVVVNQLRPFKFSEDDVERIIEELSQSDWRKAE